MAGGRKVNVTRGEKLVRQGNNLGQEKKKHLNQDDIHRVPLQIEFSEVNHSKMMVEAGGW